MTERAAETWHSRDLPLLRRIVAAFLEQPTGLLELDDVADETLSPEQTFSAVHNLRRGGYIEMGEGPKRGGWGRRYITDVTEEALRVTGTWPTPETALGRITAALERIAGTADHPAHKEAADALDAFRKAGQAFTVVANAGLTGEMP